MNHDKVAQLVTSTISGDRNAFGELVTAHQNMVAGLAFQHCRNPTQVEDIAQETFFRAYRDLQKLKKPMLFVSWLCSITVNVAREATRKQSRGQQLNEEPSVGPDVATGPDDKAVRLLSLVADLPEKYRIPLTLHYVEGLKYAEIAQMLEINESTARSSVHRARLLLRKRL